MRHALSRGAAVLSRESVRGERRSATPDTSPLLPGAKRLASAGPASEQNEIPLKKHGNSSTSSRPPGRPKKVPGEARHGGGKPCTLRTMMLLDHRSNLAVDPLGPVLS